MAAWSVRISRVTLCECRAAGRKPHMAEKLRCMLIASPHAPAHCLQAMPRPILLRSSDTVYVEFRPIPR